MRKKIILTYILVFPLFASAYDLEDSNLTYTITDTSAMTAEVTSTTSTDITSAAIPSSVTINGNTYSVTSIGDYAFYKCTSLSSISIPESVTSIEDHALGYCSSLKEIVIPESVTSIGENAFAYSGLESITIPNTVTSLGTNALYYCTSLKSAVVGNSIATIGEASFRECTHLADITIGHGVTYIDKNAFRDCGTDSSVTTLTITVNTESAPKCSAATVFGSTIPDVALNIPSTWGDSWKTANGWKDLINSNATVTTFYAVFITVTDALYATLYAEKPVAIPTGMKAYVATNTDESSVTCTTIDGGTIPATTGVLLNAEMGTFMFKETDSDETTTYASLFDGTLVDLVVSSSDNIFYTLAKEDGVVSFYRFTGTTIPANRAFLKDETGSAKGFSIVFSDNDKTTGISAAPATAKATNGAIYNLQGQRVKTPVRGNIYIQNGKKFIAK